MKKQYGQELIEMFKNGDELTVRDIKQKLNISYQNARHHLDMVSLQIPIYESGKRKIHGRPSPVFKLLDTENL